MRESFREFMESHFNRLAENFKTPQRVYDRGVAVHGTIPDPTGRVVRRRAEFQDHELAELFEWAADQLVIATPGSVCAFLEINKTEAPGRLLPAYGRWLGRDDSTALVQAWHDALEPGEMVFLPWEPWTSSESAPRVWRDRVHTSSRNLVRTVG